MHGRARRRGCGGLVWVGGGCDVPNINLNAAAKDTAVAVMAWPTAPLDTPKSAAIGVSRLIGRNSAVTRPKAPRAREMTAHHAADMDLVSAVDESVWGMMESFIFVFR